MIAPEPWRSVSVSDMRVIAKAHRVVGYSKMRRRELIAALEDAGATAPGAPHTPRHETVAQLRVPSPETLLALERDRQPPRVKPTVEVVDAAAPVRYFVTLVAREPGMQREPAALARVYGATAAERFVAGGTEWEDYPGLAYLGLGTDQMTWDPITEAEADEIQRKLAAAQPLS